ncbi:MAG: DUF5677 domain-containing protein [Betaproteobacteria bacterium]
MNEPRLVPDPPKFTEDDWWKCRDSGDYCPILFEWYKFVGALCNFFASIRPDSPAVRSIPPVHYAVLIGLLNRCSRLMLSNVALSHEGLFGETTALLDRCIFESCVKVTWLCESKVSDGFPRLIADGLKTELELKAKILANVKARDGQLLEIEKRMLSSIERHIRSSGLTESEISEAKRLPDLAAMIDGVGHDRLMYIVGQRIGSHHVHGTWPSLRMHYLEENEEGMLVPRDHNCSTHVNQYVFVPTVVLDAMRSFIRFIFADQDDVTPMEGLIESIEIEIGKVNEEVVGNDFERVTEI